MELAKVSSERALTLFKQTADVGINKMSWCDHISKRYTEHRFIENKGNIGDNKAFGQSVKCQEHTTTVLVKVEEGAREVRCVLST